jgi:hypothetical protein
LGDEGSADGHFYDLPSSPKPSATQICGNTPT